MSDKQFKLPKPFATKWLAALRGGAYKQSTGALVDQLGYCCLGVACVIGGSSNEDINAFGTITHGLQEKNPGIPEELIGDTATNELVNRLVGMNDELNKSFTEIADWVEENVEFYDAPSAEDKLEEAQKEVTGA